MIINDLAPLSDMQCAKYNEVKRRHPDDIVLFQVDDRFEAYGEDASAVADILGNRLIMRPIIIDDLQVKMCAVPASRINHFKRKLRRVRRITIVPSGITEYSSPMNICKRRTKG